MLKLAPIYFKLEDSEFLLPGEYTGEIVRVIHHRGKRKGQKTLVFGKITQAKGK